MRRIAFIAIVGISIVANAVLAQESDVKPGVEEQDSLLACLAFFRSLLVSLVAATSRKKK